jgi:glycosyltransferase involved in cell wall biosynthesis
LLAPLAARRSGRPLVVTLHQILEATPPRSIGAKNGAVTNLGLRVATHLLLRADAVCVTLRSYERTLRTHYGARNVHHIPLGAFDALEYLPYPADDLPDDILFFGSAAPFKGLTTLLDAYALLQRRRPRVSLTIAGADHPRFPGYLAGFQADVRARHGLDPTGVHWLGPQAEAQLRALFARARLVVLPYMATTGASSVLHRAVAYGRPVVASDLPDLRAVAEEEGLLADYVPPGDAAALAQTLEALLADRPRQALWAQRNLTSMRTMTLDRTCARYLELLDGPGGPAA